MNHTHCLQDLRDGPIDCLPPHALVMCPFVRLSSGKCLVSSVGFRHE